MNGLTDFAKITGMCSIHGLDELARLSVLWVKVKFVYEVCKVLPEP